MWRQETYRPTQEGYSGAWSIGQEMLSLDAMCLGISLRNHGVNCYESHKATNAIIKCARVTIPYSWQPQLHGFNSLSDDAANHDRRLNFVRCSTVSRATFKSTRHPAHQVAHGLRRAGANRLTSTILPA
jgi:hypothetical protein